MFSGIIKHFGVVVDVVHTTEAARLTTESELFAEPGDPVCVGESIAHSGVCLTVAGTAEKRAWFDVGSETLRYATLGGLQPGDPLNLERSLRFGERVDGHFVQGHVEAVGFVAGVVQEGATTRITIGYPEVLRRHLAPKGSLAIDGVSLTVGELTSEQLTVFVIPMTLKSTTIASYRIGAKVNLETDCLARYVSAAVDRGFSGES